MTVSKEELFARYKQLKSEGVSITLMELKKQMEAESGDSPQPAEQPQHSGFSALSHTPQTSYVSQPEQQPVQTTYQNSDYGNSQPVSSWSTTYISGQEQPAISTEPPHDYHYIFMLYIY